MKCGYCGKPLKDNAKFCSYCGRNISDAPVGFDKNSAKTAGSSLAAIIALILTIIIVLAGSIALIAFGIRDWNTMPDKSMAVSESDTNRQNQVEVSSSDIPAFVGDSALLGKWRCIDKSAAGYSAAADYGITVNIILTFNQDGTFVLHYQMANTGIQVRNIKLTGTYTVADGKFTLSPDLSSYDGCYFGIHGENPSVGYSASAGTLIITTGDEQQFMFTSV